MHSAQLLKMGCTLKERNKIKANKISYFWVAHSFSFFIICAEVGCSRAAPETTSSQILYFTQWLCTINVVARNSLYWQIKTEQPSICDFTLTCLVHGISPVTTAKWVSFAVTFAGAQGLWNFSVSSVSVSTKTKIRKLKSSVFKF